MLIKKITLFVLILIALTYITHDQPTISADLSNNYEHFLATRSNTTIYVGPSADFKSIQAAIDNSSKGDTIFIYAGEYNESVVIDKSLNIIGSGDQDTIILGYWTEVVVDLKADYTNISCLSIVGQGSYSGLMISGDNNIIRDCTFMWNVIGIAFKESGHNSIINCTCFQNTGAGIYLGGGHHNVFTNTNCSYTIYGSGINLWGARNNLFIDGISSFNKRDGFYAYWLSSDNTIKNYTCSNNEGNGIYILDSDRFTIVDSSCSYNDVNGFSISSLNNELVNCLGSYNNYSGFSFYHFEGSKIIGSLSSFNHKKGMYFKYSNNNEIINNTIVSNKNHSIYLGINSDKNLIYGNIFVNNKDGINQTWDLGDNNIWYSSQVNLGNFWWDYKYHYPESDLVNNIWNNSFEIQPGEKSIDKYPSGIDLINASYIESLHPGIWTDLDLDGIFDIIDEFPDNADEYKDSDHDGFGDNSDAFPSNPAASVDSDSDGHPDAWNPGWLGKDSDTGLILDQFPNDPDRWVEDTGEENADSIVILYVICGLIILIGISLFILWFNYRRLKTN